MATTKKPAQTSNSFIQLVVNFVLPSIVLLKFSGESSLGPIKAMLLALAFPVLLELYTLSQRRKPNVLSVIAIVGIIVTGAITMLGLSEGWLAVRRSVPYFAIALVILVSVLMKRSLIRLALPYLLDMERIQARAEERGTWPEIESRIRTATYWLIGLLVIIGISSYVLTLVVITAHTGTEAFNTEYVRLRVLSLPATTLPLFVGFVGLLMYLITSLEKLTGLSTEELVKKKKP